MSTGHKDDGKYSREKIYFHSNMYYWRGSSSIIHIWMKIYCYHIPIYTHLYSVVWLMGNKMMRMRKRNAVFYGWLPRVSLHSWQNKNIDVQLMMTEECCCMTDWCIETDDMRLSAHYNGVMVLPLPGVFAHWAMSEHCTQRNIFEIVLNETEISLYTPFFDWFGIKQMFICCSKSIEKW